MTNLIKTENLKKQFIGGNGQELLLFDDLNFQVPSNSLTAIFGNSGSGKSTLLHLLGGLDRPNQGRVLFLNQDLAQLTSNALAEWRNREVGFVFQFHHLLKGFTALENVLMPDLISNQPAKASEERALDLLEKMQLQDRLKHHPSELSGGEQQRIAIARALIARPKIIFADEPTGNLDDKTEEIVLNLLIQTCREQQAALVIVTHNVEIRTMVDRCFYLRQYQLHQSPE